MTTILTFLSYERNRKKGNKKGEERKKEREKEREFERAGPVTREEM